MITAALDRQSLPRVGSRIVAGLKATYPVFICGDVVVKLFGFLPTWRRSHAAEQAADRLLGTDPRIPAPSLLAEGELFDDLDAPWPYLVTTRMPGTSWRGSVLAPDERRAIAADLGMAVGHLQALVPSGDEPTSTAPPNIARARVAATNSSLPSHLVDQVGDFLSELRPYDRTFVHGDLVKAHAFVQDGRLAGVIDWGDARVTDRHYELGKLYFELFDCDRELLRVFLDASGWPTPPDFARQALGLALHRQVHGLEQHHTFDVFEPVASVVNLTQIETLDDLAERLFTV